MTSCRLVYPMFCPVRLFGINTGGSPVKPTARLVPHRSRYVCVKVLSVHNVIKSAIVCFSELRLMQSQIRMKQKAFVRYVHMFVCALRV